MTCDEVINRVNQMNEDNLARSTERLNNSLMNFCENHISAAIELGFSDLSRSIELLRTRVEQDGTRTFFVLIVGPVKSGKSTFVNLLADDIVSLMDNVECTMKPTFVVKSCEGSNRIFSVNHDENSTDGQVIENMINRIRSIGDITELTTDDTIIETLLNENNLAAQNLDENTVMNIVCSQGGTLLAENVYLVDMPGLDGAVANMQNIPYEDVAREVDFVIFVQSSGSINETSVNFLNRLHEINGNIPVCLVHNFFDAAYWKTIEEKNAIRDSQVNNAVQELNNHNFLVNADDVFKINLGKVYDYTFRYEDIDFDKWDNDDFESECSNFDNIQTIIHERLTNSTRLRYKNHIGRIWRQIDEIKKIIKEKKEIVKKYETYKTEIDNQDYNVADIVEFIKEKLDVKSEGAFNTKCSFKEADEDNEVAPKNVFFVKHLVGFVEDIKQDCLNELASDNQNFNRLGCCSEDLAIKLLESYKDDYRKKLDCWLSEIIAQTIIKEKIEKIENWKKKDDEGTELSSFIGGLKDKIETDVPIFSFENFVSFTYDYFKSYPSPFNRLVSIYCKNDFKRYIRTMYEYLTGDSVDGNGNNQLIHCKILKGDDFVEKYLEYLEKQYKKTVRRRKDALKEIVEKKKLEKLYPGANNMPERFRADVLDNIESSLSEISFGL